MESLYRGCLKFVDVRVNKASVAVISTLFWQTLVGLLPVQTVIIAHSNQFSPHICTEFRDPTWFRDESVLYQKYKYSTNFKYSQSILLLKAQRPCLCCINEVGTYHLIRIKHNPASVSTASCTHQMALYRLQAQVHLYTSTSKFMICIQNTIVFVHCQPVDEDI